MTVAEQLAHLQEPATRWRYEAVVGDDDLADWLVPLLPNPAAFEGTTMAVDLTADDEANLVVVELSWPRAGRFGPARIRVENTFAANGIHLGRVVAPQPSEVVDSATVTLPR